jgi:hypothetical protein
LVPIETIKVGDLVLSKNEVTGEIAPKPVRDLIRPAPKPLYQLKLRDASGEVETFHATDDHPWKVEGKGWVETVNLRSEDRIDTASGADMVLLSVKLTKRVEHTYNLTIADWQTFLVGDDQVVVHNCKPVKGESFRGGKKGSRDQWYGYDDKGFQRWWHREGKKEFGGGDIQSKSEAKEVFDHWKAIGSPTPK